MARVPTYESKTSANVGLINTRSTASDFGGMEAQAFGQFGDVLSKAASVSMKIAEDDAKIWAMDALTKAKMQWAERVSTLDGSQSPKDIDSEFVDFANKQLDGAPSALAKQNLKQGLDPIRQGVFSHALSKSAASRAMSAKDATIGAIESNVRMAYQGMVDPQSAIESNFDNVGQIFPINSTMTSQIARDAWQYAYAKEMELNGIDISSNPSLNPSQKNEARLQSEIKFIDSADKIFHVNQDDIGRSKSWMDQNKDLIIDSMSKTGDVPSGFRYDDILVNAYKSGGDKQNSRLLAGRKMANDMKIARDTYVTKTEIVQQPIQRWQSLIQDIKNPEIQKNVKIQIDSISENIKSGDFSRVALESDPIISQKNKAWIESVKSGSQNSAALFEDFAESSSLFQDRLGIYNKDKRLLPKSQASEIATGIMNSSSHEERMAKIQKLPEIYGRYANNVLSELVSNGLSGSTAVMAGMAGEPRSISDSKSIDGVWNIIRNEKISEHGDFQKVIFDKFNVSEKERKKIEFQTGGWYKNDTLSKLRQALIGSGDQDNADSFTEQVHNTALSLAAAASRNDPSSSFVKSYEDAIDFYVGKAYNFNSSNGKKYIVPKNVSGMEINSSDVASGASKIFDQVTNVSGFDWKSLGRWSANTALFMANPIVGATRMMSGVSDFERGLKDTRSATGSFNEKWISNQDIESAAKSIGVKSDDLKIKAAKSIRAFGYWANDGDGLTLMYENNVGTVPQRIPIMRDVYDKDGNIIDSKPIHYTFKELVDIARTQRNNTSRSLEESPVVFSISKENKYNSNSIMIPMEENSKEVEILKKYKDLNFVDRVLNAQNYPQLDNIDGNPNTHLMSYASVTLDGKEKNIVYPTVVYDKETGSLYKPKDPIRYALKSKEFIPFETEEEARKFSEGGYKKGFPKIKYNNGR